MKFLYLTLCVLMIAVGTNAVKYKRQNTAATAYPTVPPLINDLTSNLFQRGNISGESAIYQFLSNLSSMVYPAIANATFNVFQSLNPVLGGISSNIYYGLCAPPTPLTTKTPSTSNTTNPTSPPGPNIGAILSAIPVLGSLSKPSTSPTSMPTTSPSNSSLLTSLLPLITPLLSGGNNSMGSPGMNPLSSILGPLLGGNSTGGGLSGGIPNSDPLAFLTNVKGASGYNGTFNLSNSDFIQLLANSTNMTPQQLQAALNKLGITPQQFVDGFNRTVQTLAQYFQQIFAQAAAATTAAPTTASNSTSSAGAGSLNQLLTLLSQIVG